ncbi:hypothetical protein [Flavobacterium sp. ov086]|uniref:hypothetical protein n=1 Tax=Flavobacterium sp. ov086 TaxID=1761785 RepID=UPI000B747EA0|nr:hypothetical protein [Flavobacterium sp. ov086]SNR55395.1 hypothetical protein SAMN04487979_11122 [Flavobacterium sp. ov086]
MKKILFLISILILISCKKEKIESQSFSKLITKREFPLKNYSKIELISYYNRVVWDTKYKGEPPIYKVLVDNYKLTFDSTMIQERVVLNKVQEKELLNLMVCDTCALKQIESACYNPRHMILFRDDKNRIIGYNEFCMECYASSNSANLDGFQKYCYSDMEALFKKFGINLFMEDSDKDQEYIFFKDKGILK